MGVPDLQEMVRNRYALSERQDTVARELRHWIGLTLGFGAMTLLLFIVLCLTLMP